MVCLTEGVNSLRSLKVTLPERGLEALFGPYDQNIKYLESLLSVRVGRAFPGGNGLALAMAVAAVLILPVGVAQGGADLLLPAVLVSALAIACLSSLIPYSLELAALLV